MCDHKYRLSENDKRFLKKNRFATYDCADCEAQVRINPTPKKIRIEEKEDDDVA